MIKWLNRFLCLAFVGAIALNAQAQDTIPEKQDVVDAFLYELLDFAKDAGAFAKEQVPLVLQEYITWGIVSSIIWMLPFLAFAFFVPRLLRIASKMEPDEGAFLGVLVFFGSATSVIAIVYHSLDAAKAIFAPRVYLIETLSELLK